MPLSRFISKNLWPSGRLLIPAAIGLAVLAVTVGQPALAGEYIECQTTSCDPDTSSSSPSSSPPAPISALPALNERNDREDDRRFQAIQQCCHRIADGLPLRGAYCSYNTLQQTLNGCQPPLNDRFAGLLQAPGSQMSQGTQVPKGRQVSQNRANPAAVRIPVISRILDLIIGDSVARLQQTPANQAPHGRHGPHKRTNLAAVRIPIISPLLDLIGI